MMEAIKNLWALIASFIQGLTNLSVSFEYATEVAVVNSKNFRDMEVAEAESRLVDQQVKIKALRSKAAK
jgi:hypothetical protein